MRLKSIYSIALCALGAISLASCEFADSDVVTASDLTIDATQIAIHTTRGVEYFTPEDNDGEYMLPTDPTQVSLPLAIRVMTEEVQSKIQSSAEFTCYDYTWTPDKLKLDGNDVNVYAWYPTDLPKSDKISVSTPKVVTHQSCFNLAETETKDYIYGQGENTLVGGTVVSGNNITYTDKAGNTLTAVNSRVKLKMHHALTKIHVQIQREATYTGKGAISELYIYTEDGKVSNTASMNVKTGEISDCDGGNNCIKWEIPESEIATDSLSDYYALTIPMPAGGQRPIKFALKDGDEYIETGDLREKYAETWADEYLEWKPENEYKYIIRLRGRQLKVSVVSVEDYEDVDANGDDDWIDIEPNKDQN